MSDDTSIQVNFGRPMPIFPLDAVTLLPQQVLPLHIFEPRYRQLVDHALDGSGQIAMAVFEGDDWKQDYHGRPSIRPAVCIGQIIQHEKLMDGRYNLLLQGICRARVIEELPPEDGREYRLALLEPVGLDPATQVIIESGGEDDDDDEEPDQPGLELEPPPDLGLTQTPTPDESETLTGVRARLSDMLSEGPLTQMAAAEPILEYVKNAEIPVGALLELVSFTLISEPSLRYVLLAEPDVEQRAALIMRELNHLSSLIRRAGEQRPQDWPKGCSWN